MSVHVDACLCLSNNFNAVFSFACVSSEDQSTVDHSACMNVVEQAPSRRFLGSFPGGSDGVGAHRWQSPGTLPHRLNIPMSAFQQLHGEKELNPVSPSWRGARWTCSVMLLVPKWVSKVWIEAMSLRFFVDQAVNIYFV